MPDPAGAIPILENETLAEMLAPKRTALLVVDIQRDFASPDGQLGQAGVDMAPAGLAVDRIEQMIVAARTASATVFFMRVVTSPQTDSTALKTLMRRRGRPGGEAICRAHGGGADWYRLYPQAGDIVIDKRLFNSFHGTDLDAQLRSRRIDTVLIAGVSTDCCVDATARDAFHRDYHVFVVRDGCAAYEPDLHEGALRALEKNCALLVDSADVIEAWQD